MILRRFSLSLLLSGLLSCSATDQKSTTTTTYPDIKIAGAMKNVMWKGELAGIIKLDTIAHKTGLYGLGPESYLTGELLVNDGRSYVSRVLTDSTMTVQETYALEAPFFVYGNTTEWKEVKLPESVRDAKALETYIDEQTTDYKRPFIFKVIGKIAFADIHVQKLPEGTTVSSPAEAHQGQTNYQLTNEEVEIIGFFSTEHQAVFTHHDSYVHMHLITKDKTQMGHLDQVELTDEVKLYLPVR